MHRSQGWSSNCRFTLHRLVQSMQGRARRSKRLQFFFLYYFTCSWNWNFPAFSCALKFHGNTTGFTQEKRRKHFFFIRVDIRSKLAGARCLCAIAYSACKTSFLSIFCRSWNFTVFLRASFISPWEHGHIGKDGSRNRRHFSKKKKAWAADLNKHLLNRNLLDQTVCPLILLTSVKRFFHHHPHQARRNRLQKVFISKIFYKTVRIEPEKSNHFFTSTMPRCFNSSCYSNSTMFIYVNFHGMKTLSSQRTWNDGEAWGCLQSLTEFVDPACEVSPRAVVKRFFVLDYRQLHVRSSAAWGSSRKWVRERDKRRFICTWSRIERVDQETSFRGGPWRARSHVRITFTSSLF